MYREEITNISHRQDAMVSVMFVRSTVGGGLVGLVLVLAAMNDMNDVRSVGFFGLVEWNNIPLVNRHTDSYLAFKSLTKEAMLNPLSLIGDVQ